MGYSSARDDKYWLVAVGKFYADFGGAVNH